jgi:ketosteroid isomerase-like protein
MDQTIDRDAHDEVWEVVEAINRAWLDGRIRDLRPLFHEHVVIAPMPGPERVRGINACIASYEDFCTRAEVQEFRESGPAVDVFGDTAITSYCFEITWTSGGETYHETGQEILVMIRQASRWQVVWRSMVSTPQQN